MSNREGLGGQVGSMGVAGIWKGLARSGGLARSSKTLGGGGGEQRLYLAP